MTLATTTTRFDDFLATGDAARLIKAIARIHAADLAAELEDTSPGDVAKILKALPGRRSAEIFGYLPQDLQAEVVELFDQAGLARLMTAMSHDERADLFNRLSPEQQQALLLAVAQTERDDIRRLAAYPEDTAGSVMTSDFATLSAQATAEEALEALGRDAPDKETINDAYVVDITGRLTGVVSLRDLLTADDKALVGDIMRQDIIFARAEDPREDVALKIAEYDLLALPIVNGGDRMVGIVTADDAMDVAIERATRDFHSIGAVHHIPVERTGAILNVREAGIWMLYRMRIVWLVLLVFGNIFSGAGIAYFEDTIAAYVALVFFLPLLIDSGGNAGSQSATLMVRALGTGDVRVRDWTQMIGKEVLVAALLGLSMAAAVSVIGLVRGGPEIALVVSLSMIVVVIVGSCVGMSLPFLLSRFKADPATASAPLVTSIADTLGVLIYFSIATTLLQPQLTG